MSSKKFTVHKISNLFDTLKILVLPSSDMTYVVYSESSWTELLERHVKEGRLLTLAFPTP
jgi:hypothetical protein